MAQGQKPKVVIIGGGAAGIFAAALCAELAPHLEVIVLEKTRQLLAKVRISGGGRCNVTHSQFDAKKLTQHYPRGNKELLGPFHRFQPQDTIAWFARHGVELKTEEDGRMFPTTDHSSAIVNCLLDAAKAGGVEILSERTVKSVEKVDGGFIVHIDKEDPIPCSAVILATGSNPHGHALAVELGHTIVSPVPSLFTFNVPTSPLLDLAGIAVTGAELSLKESSHKQLGSLLLTHWGFSGPAALKLSAWAARDLNACNYRTELKINWAPSLSKEEAAVRLQACKQQKPLRSLDQENLFQLPLNLWKRFLTLSGIQPGAPMGHIGGKILQALAERVTASTFAVEGKTTYKTEFVTCGGVELKEIDFKTLQSRKVPGLYFAGEVLNIDGVTGGFNFQNAWTTAYLAVSGIAASTQ